MLIQTHCSLQQHVQILLSLLYLHRLPPGNGLQRCSFLSFRVHVLTGRRFSQLNSRLVLLITTPRHGAHKKHLSQVLYCCATYPTENTASQLLHCCGHYLATGLHAKYDWEKRLRLQICRDLYPPRWQHRRARAEGQGLLEGQTLNTGEFLTLRAGTRRLPFSKRELQDLRPR
jgi:hypothetical protein